ncbi:hypothetical protein BKA64DRAFT_652906 [Cadophora sp. MPI-SDFR-AT-0126]|nr:hypothetical protein BKA64DRAFT_652906 [Leotiomycetes sp. MPI-SDFR-AT-0126]
MSYSPVSQSQKFEATRVTLTSPKLYSDVLTALYTSIGSPDVVGEWLKSMKGISQSVDAREQFDNSVNNMVGPHGFMIMQEFNHGAWLPFFGEGQGLKSARIILGNPLIAITMLKHDINAGLFVPVEILLLEKKGGTEITYDLPSGLITGLNKDPELVSASEKLDEKLAALLKDVLS